MDNENLELVEDENIWVFKEHGDDATVQSAKGLVNQLPETDFKNLHGKRIGDSWRGETRIVVVEMNRE